MKARDRDDEAGAAAAPPTLKTLPARDYVDPGRYQQELVRIWYRSWIYVCRSDALEGARAWRVFTIGTQEVLLLRDADGILRAFHNTCRHRGSALCQGFEGRFEGNAITCPYHAWRYDLRGRLAGIPRVGSPARLTDADLSLYAVSLQEWQGCVFVNLADEDAPPFDMALDPGAEALSNWPLADLVVAHRYRKQIRCNWKVFWENFQECYHCPGIHPELCNLVPIYGKAVTGVDELRAAGEVPAPADRDGLREGAETWSRDGLVHGTGFATLTDAERAAGQRFLTVLPGMFMIAHADYVRIVAVAPLGPELLQLEAEWLFPPETLADPGFDLENCTAFATRVLNEDAAACEINQRGLRCIRHEHGVLVPRESGVHEFHKWVQREMGESEPG